MGSRSASATKGAHFGGNQATRRSHVRVFAWQLLILVIGLSVWQWLPAVPGVRNLVTALDPFFISAPDRIAARTWALLTGAENTETVWPYLLTTVAATLGGTTVGLLIGALAGLLLSSSSTLNRVLRPYIMAVNATPRIALIPIVVILLGPTPKASAASALLLVIFIVFFNALEGGRAIAQEIIDNARILGASEIQIMGLVRMPYVIAWTFAALPNAISFGLVGVVTAEILTGVNGMGRLLQIAISTVDATLTFSVVLLLSIVGILLVSSTALMRQRILHWWDQPEAKI